MDRTYLTGVILVIASASIWSSAGIFTRGVDADAWSVIFWRSLSATGFTLIYLLWRRQLMSEVRQINAITILAIVVMASGTAAFIPAFKLSSVANVALIWATAPLVSAGLAWGLLRERPTRRIVMASIATLCGVLMIGWGSLRGGGLIGDLLAFWMVLMMSLSFIIYRRRPETPAALPAALSALVWIPFAIGLAEPTEVVARERWILAVFGLVFAVASVLMLEGARRIPAAEVALLGALETPLAPILAFVILAESPTVTTLAGGAFILFAVLWAQLNGLRKVKE